MRLACLLLGTGLLAGAIDLHQAVVVVRPGDLPPAEKTAARVLVEEVRKRTGIQLRTSTVWPQQRPVIALSSVAAVPEWKHRIPAQTEKRAEGYRLYAEDPVIWILGADARGTLFGVGQLLRRLEWGRGQLSLPTPVDISTAPTQSIRGHQLGYRAQANSYDAWTPEQFEQYIRELTFFGVNSIESIPFQDERPTPVMKVPRREMNRAVSEICFRYGLDYWAWIPADFDLNDTALRTKMLGQIGEFIADSPELSGIFVPGGDPGHNPPELVLPFLQDMGKILRRKHPNGKVWLSLQWFSPKQIDYIFEYIARTKPDWLGGLIGGPSGPPLADTRARLPKQYRLRDYPDITHNVRCQFQVPGWDQAFARTLGREAINPRPVEYAAIHQLTVAPVDGFISYSDGAHDDVNKIIWSALSWDASLPVPEILKDYARIYFKPRVAASAVEGILALEKNWQGPLLRNSTVPQTLQKWQAMEKSEPELAGNWRWQMCLLRAYYDAYTQIRLKSETKLEQEANAVLARAREIGAEKAVTRALTILKGADESPAPELRSRITELCEQLYRSVGLQTSVPKYHAINPERGAVLDFLDLPLNNRWWLEDEFAKAHENPDKLMALAKWEHPAPGSYYDVVGDPAKSPHVIRGRRQPTYWWWDLGRSRARLSWQVSLWPEQMVYEGLDATSSYTLRTSGYGQALPRANGARLKPGVNGTQMGEFKEFPIDASQIHGGKLVITWDPPEGEESLNWRNKSRLSEVWLLRK